MTSRRVIRSQVAFTGGRSRLERAPDLLGAGNLRDATNQSALAVLTWRYLPSPRVSLDPARRRRREPVPQFQPRRRGARRRRRRRSHLSGGRVVLAGRARARRRRRRSAPHLGHRPRATSGRRPGSRHARRTTARPRARSLYGQVRLGVVERLLHHAWRSCRSRSLVDADDRVSLGADAVAGDGSDRGSRRRAACITRRPDFAEVLGTRGDARSPAGARLPRRHRRRRTAWHAGRWQMTVYNREDRDLLRLPDTELRVVNGVVLNGSVTSRYVNALDGHARGVEWLVQRQSPNGFSGWASVRARVRAVSRSHDRRIVLGRLRSAPHGQPVWHLSPQRSSERQRAIPRRQQLSNGGLLGFPGRRRLRRRALGGPQHVAGGAVLAPRRAREPHVHVGSEAADAVPRSDQRLQPDERPRGAAVSQPSNLRGHRPVRADGSADSVGRHPAGVLRKLKVKS